MLRTCGPSFTRKVREEIVDVEDLAPGRIGLDIADPVADLVTVLT